MTGGRGGGEYQQLDHKGKGGAKVDNRKHLPPSEEYGTLETETVSSHSWRAVTINKGRVTYKVYIVMCTFIFL